MRRLSPKHGFPDRERLRLQRFLTGLRVVTEAGGNKSLRPIRKLSAQGAADMRFALREGGVKTVAVCTLYHHIVFVGSHFCNTQAYFRETYNIRLEHPDAVCVEVGRIPPFAIHEYTLLSGLGGSRRTRPH